jgi:hypothetical protein
MPKITPKTFALGVWPITNQLIMSAFKSFKIFKVSI